MTTTEFELLDEVEAERILSWRFTGLVRAGYSCDDALALAVRVDVDLHSATTLLARGCPPETACRILF